MRSADWSDERASWRVVAEGPDGTEQVLHARWLYLGSGYYDYDNPHDPGFDTGQFAGQVIHPQFWPEDLDYTGKRVVVIGSGATAVTLVPALAELGADVTMLQRTPSYIGPLPEKDVISALADAEVVTQIKKPWGKGHYRKDRAFLLMGRFEEAREAVQLGLSLEPANTVCALELVRIAFTNVVLACIRNSAIF